MFKEWFQIFTNIAVVIGLGAVIYELNQNHLHNRTQLVASSFEFWNSRLLAQMGENPSPIISKYLTDPEPLTATELVVVHGYLGTIFLEREYSAKMADLGTMDPIGVNGTDLLARRYINSCVGLEWWDANRFDHFFTESIIESEIRELRTRCETGNDEA